MLSVLPIVPGTLRGGSVRFDWSPNPLVVAQKVDYLADRLNFLAEPLLLAKEVVIADVQEHFDTETAPDGSKWEPWSITYKAWRDEYGGLFLGDNILQLTTEMIEAATSRDSYMVDGNDLFLIGAALPDRWIWHQEGATRQSFSSETIAALEQAGGGTSYGENILPARPFIGLGEDAKVEIAGIFAEWVAETVQITVFASGSRAGQAQRKSPTTGRFM